MSEKENKGTLPEEKTEVVSDEKLKDVAGGILFSASPPPHLSGTDLQA